MVLCETDRKTQETWQSVTAQLAMASSIARLAKRLQAPRHGELDCSPGEALRVSRYGELGFSVLYHRMPDNIDVLFKDVLFEDVWFIDV